MKKSLPIISSLVLFSSISYGKESVKYEVKLTGQYKNCYAVINQEPDYSVTLEKTGDCDLGAITVFGIDTNNFQHLLVSSVPPVEKGVRMKYAPALLSDDKKPVLKRLIIATFGDEDKGR
jgi:hypothetical protein